MEGEEDFDGFGIAGILDCTHFDGTLRCVVGILWCLEDVGSNKEDNIECSETCGVPAYRRRDLPYLASHVIQMNVKSV